MYSQKVSDVITNLARVNKLAQAGVIFWNSLILPVLIAIFVTHLLEVYKQENGSISNLVWSLVVLVTFFHFFIVYLQFRGSSMDTMLCEYQEKDAALKDIGDEFSELDKLYQADTQFFSSQRSATRFAVSSLSYAIGKIRNIEQEGERAKPEEMQAMLHSLIWPLVVYREKLFNFQSGVLWNIALYGPNNDGDLIPIWRMCDERIQPRNRVWKPGFGVVGLSYLHKTIKYHEDISKGMDSEHNSEADKETYKSIIAVPVVPCEDGSSSSDHRPSGVLLITSSAAEQFNLDRDASFLQIYANLVAILLEKIQTYTEHTLVDKTEGGSYE
ncbi:GAF domain-containing protein [Vibrio vulnificus]|nr:GAF domain-containing protein [Vibrio vulnificus]EGQ9284030.1 GAF domain-containing protein [Vibrio vulnificus]EIJ0943880.1 GAF domain-containing protein [Vibrio vulnificus]